MVNKRVINTIGEIVGTLYAAAADSVELCETVAVNDATSPASGSAGLIAWVATSTGSTTPTTYGSWTDRPAPNRTVAGTLKFTKPTLLTTFRRRKSTVI